MIVGYHPQAFIINSAIIFFLSDRVLNIYDYIIGYEENIDKIKCIFGGEYIYDDKYELEHSGYVCLITYIVMCIFYVITLISYRMDFDQSINNTEYELFLSIALSIWTFVIISNMNKVNSKTNKRVKMIKS